MRWQCPVRTLGPDPAHRDRVIDRVSGHCRDQYSERDLVRRHHHILRQDR